MRKSIFTAISCGLAGLLFVMPSQAQNTNRFAFSAGGGFTTPVFKADGPLKIGLNANVGAGINANEHVGVMVEFGFNELGISERALSNLAMPDGSARMYSATLNPIVRFNPRGRMDFYLIGGGGYYRRTVEFTEPAIATVNVFDPFLGFIVPVNIVVDSVLDSFTQNKPGWNIGGGVTFQVAEDSNAKIFAEARYHQAMTDPETTTYLPVTFGFRW
jgi:opacity protein-like surface antigen